MDETKPQELPALGEPPRPVGWALVLLTLFSGGAQALGWSLITLLFGALLIFEPGLKTRASLAFLYSETETTEARILKPKQPRVIQPAKRVGSPWRRGRTIHRYRFQFQSGENEIRSVSYSDLDLRYEETAEVEYPIGRPRDARVVGSRSGELGWQGVVMFFILGGVGLLSLILSFPWRLQRLALLRRGRPSWARLKSQTESNISVGGEPIRKLVFEYRPEGAITPLETTVKSTVLPDENQPVPLLYLPSKPSKAILLSDLPSSAEVNSKGYFSTPNAKEALGLFALPMAAFLCAVGWIALAFQY